jgi:hypothetical protein
VMKVLTGPAKKYHRYPLSEKLITIYPGVELDFIILVYLIVVISLQRVVD